MDSATLNLLLTSIADHRLVVFSGAGLSIPPPSSIPSAAQLADEIIVYHYQLTGEKLPDSLKGDIEAVAKLFYDRGQLESHMLGRLVRWVAFRHSPPNEGHFAIADFLACGWIEFSVTANVDYLTEAAMQALGDLDFVSSLDGVEAQNVQLSNPLLKLHGCSVRNHIRTMWCLDQLAEPVWEQLIDLDTLWLQGHLLQRDLIFVGYWTDWAYLNGILVRCLGTNLPRTVILVDPADEATLETKAKDLWDWAHRPGINFVHEQMSGAAFLRELRQAASLHFLTRACEGGRDAHSRQLGVDSTVAVDFSALTVDELYALRRDFTGRKRSAVVRARTPEQVGELLGEFVLSLLHAGATLNGDLFLHAGKSIRLLNGQGRFLSDIRNEFGSDTLPVGDPDIVACVGAHDDGGVPSHIIRAATPSSVVRPKLTSEWLTYQQARDTLRI